MTNISQTEALNWLAKYSCSQPGVQELNEWSVHGFYDDKFDDPWNLNLSENTVSLLTAIATSFSIILFVDIVFRVHVRAKNCRMTSQMVQRRLVLEDFSSPINVLSFVFRRVTGNRSAESEDSCPQTPYHGLSKWTYGNLMFMGVLIVLIQFLFIFLATNQSKAHKLRLEAVPVFEFEDRGCEYLSQPGVSTCDYVPLTEKPGFDSRATIQICSTNTVNVSNPSFVSDSFFFLGFKVLNIGRVEVIVGNRNMTNTWIQSTEIGVYVRESKKFYVGMQDVKHETLLSALLNRLERTNLTVLTSATSHLEVWSETSETVGDRLQRRDQSNMDFRTRNLNKTSVSVLVDASNVELRETPLGPYILTEEEDVDQQEYVMRMYMFGVLNSIMFPTGKSRGVFSLSDKDIFLDEDTTPLVYYNRPWIGVVRSFIICCTSLLTWIFLAVLGIEGDIDSRLAWKKFFNCTEISQTDKSEGDGDELHARD